MQQSISGYGQEVISALYQHHAHALYKYCMVSTRSREDAEDMLVDIFMAALAFADLAKLNEQQQLAWLWRVARNKVIDFRRRAARHAQSPLDTVQDLLFDENAEHLPEDQAMRHENRAFVLLQIAHLPALQQEVVRLRFLSGLSCAEIAQILGKTENAVRVSLSRALNTLRKLYEQHQGERYL